MSPLETPPSPEKRRPVDKNSETRMAWDNESTGLALKKATPVRGPDWPRCRVLAKPYLVFSPLESVVHAKFRYSTVWGS